MLPAARLAHRPSEDVLDSIAEDLNSELGNIAVNLIRGAWETIEWLEAHTVELFEADAKARAELLTISAAMSLPTRGWYVYALYDEEVDSVPFYIGMTGGLLARLGTHATAEDKRHRIARVALTQCPSKAEALRLEQEMIRTWRPELNIQHMPSLEAAG